jgi:hypothetical protein
VMETRLSGAAPNPDARIVIARGVLGTPRCLAFTRHDQRRVLLTTHHVLSDNDGREDEPVCLTTGTCLSRSKSTFQSRHPSAENPHA